MQAAIKNRASSAYPPSAKGQKPSPSNARHSASEDAVPPRITAPQDGTILALDPDIPPARQRLQFTATRDAVQWRLDGKPLGRGARVPWLPWPGRHVVQITDAQGQVLAEAPTVGNWSARRICQVVRACSMLSTATRRSRLFTSASRISSRREASPTKSAQGSSLADRVAEAGAAGAGAGQSAATGAAGRS